MPAICLLGLMPPLRHGRTRTCDRVGVPLYFIVDQARDVGPRRLLAYRDTPAGFEELPLDERGCVLLEALGLRLGMRNDRVVCYDADTGEEVRTPVAEYAARVAADERARQQAEARQAAEQRLRELEA